MSILLWPRLLRRQQRTNDFGQVVDCIGFIRLQCITSHLNHLPLHGNLALDMNLANRHKFFLEKSEKLLIQYISQTCCYPLQ